MADLQDILEKLQDTSAAIARVERTAVENPDLPSVVANLRSLRKRHSDLEIVFREIAASLELDVCHYRIVVNERPTIAGLSAIWGDFQALFSLVYDALKNGPKLRARAGADVVNETALGFAYSYPGSVGAVLTLTNERLLLGRTLLDDAIETTMEVVRTPDTQSLAALSKKLGPPPIRAAYKWAEDQLAYGMESEVTWRRREQLKASFLVQKPELEKFRSIADATSPQETEEIICVVDLLGADISTHSFHAEMPDGTPIRGKAMPGLIDQTNKVELPQSYRATILKTTIVRFSLDDPDVSWLLTMLEKV